MAKQTPSKGRVVLFVLGARYANSSGASRPAIITEAHENGDCALVVFTDAGPDGASPVVYVRAARNHEGERDEEGTLRHPPDTWHWPPYVPPTADDKIARREQLKEQPVGATESKPAKIAQPAFMQSMIDTSIARRESEDEKPTVPESSGKPPFGE